MAQVKELPLDDRPREKLILRGPQNLSDSDLLAILIRTGIRGKSAIELAQNLLSNHTNIAILATKSVEAISKLNGIGKDKAATLVAAFELNRRIEAKNRWIYNKQITCPEEIASYFIPLMRDSVKEEFIVCALSSSNKIINYKSISIGSLNISIVHPREVFRFAIENDAANIILLHNHPSGNPDPSQEDINLTNKIIEAGKMMEIGVFDHIIIAGNKYLSFSEKRLI